MPDPRESLARVWDRFRQSGVADDLAIIEHVAALLLDRRGIPHPSPDVPWPEPYPGSDLDESARRDIEKFVAEAVEGSASENPEADVLDPPALFRPSRLGAPGQYPTPRHVVRLMHRLADVRPRHALLDLACGSGGFLAHRAAYEATGPSVGVEVALRWARIAAATTALRLGEGNATILQQNALVALGNAPELDPPFDRVLMNPPFGGKMERKLLERLGGVSGRSETVLGTLALGKLKPGGRAALLLPAGPLFSNGGAETAFRELMLTGEYHLRAAVALPRDAFQPYSGTQTYLLLLDHERVEDGHTWMCRPMHDGYPAGQSRDLTGKGQEADDFPLLEAALGAAPLSVEIDPGPHGDVLVSVGLVTAPADRLKVSEGVVVHAHPDAVIEFAEWHPPAPPLDRPESGFVVLLALSFSDTVRTLVIDPGAERVRQEDDVARWRSNRYPRNPDADSGSEESPDPRIVLFDVRAREEERAGGAAFAVTAQGVLLGRTVPVRVVQASLDPRPESYLAPPRDAEVATSSAELLREIRRKQLEAARHLDALSDSAGTLPRAATRPVPFANDEALAVFGELSARQERVYQVVRAWPTQTMVEDEETYEVVAPFSAEQVGRKLAEQGEAGGAIPLAAVHGTLQILEAMGIIVQAHLPESRQALEELPYYRLATPYDAPAPAIDADSPAPAAAP